VARATLSGNMIFFFYKFPLFCDNMDNFVHNAANKTSEFLQYVVVIDFIILAPGKPKDKFPRICQSRNLDM
jgi:hypothetical protein